MSECRHKNRNRNVREYGRFSHHCVDCDKDLDPDHNQMLEKVEKLEEENEKLKKDIFHFKKIILEEKRNVRTLKHVINGHKKLHALEMGFLKNKEIEDE